jgi:hypothetical protein
LLRRERLDEVDHLAQVVRYDLELKQIILERLAPILELIIEIASLEQLELAVSRTGGGKEAVADFLGAFRDVSFKRCRMLTAESRGATA